MGIGSPCTAYGTCRHWISVAVVIASALAITFERSNIRTCPGRSNYVRTEYGRAIDALVPLERRPL